MKSNNHGMGLLGIIIGIGASSAVIMGLLSTVNQVTATNRVLNTKLDLLSLAREIEVRYTDTALCSDTFQGLKLNTSKAYIGSNREQYPTGINKIRLFGQNIENYSYASVKIKSLGIDVIANTGSTLEAWMVVTPLSAGGSDLPLKPVKIPLQISTNASGQITGCTSSREPANEVATKDYYAEPCPSGTRETNRYWAPRSCVANGGCQTNSCSCSTPVKWSRSAPSCSFRPTVRGKRVTCRATDVILRKCS